MRQVTLVCHCSDLLFWFSMSLLAPHKTNDPRRLRERPRTRHHRLRADMARHHAVWRV